MSDTNDTSAAAEVEAPAPAPAQVAQPVEVPRAQTTPQGGGWFRGALRSGIVAAVVVVVAGAFFTIGWFTSTRGDYDRTRMMNGIQQMMDQRAQDGWQPGTDQQGAGQGQGYRKHGRGMGVPQQGQGQGQTLPTTPSQPTIPSQPTTPSTQQSQLLQQGYLGVGVQTVTPQLQQQYGLSRADGVLVASIDRSGPAVKAGIQQGDIITGINGVAVTLQEEVVSIIGKMKAGESATLTIDRNGQSLTVQVTLAARAGSITG
jgi:membrane-associated protease RseP (regulator of RpoE activity)